MSLFTVTEIFNGHFVLVNLTTKLTSQYFATRHEAAILIFIKIVSYCVNLCFSVSLKVIINIFMIFAHIHPHLWVQTTHMSLWFYSAPYNLISDVIGVHYSVERTTLHNEIVHKKIADLILFI